MTRLMISVGFLLASVHAAFSWQLIQNDEDAFGGKTVQVADIDVSGNGLNVSCNSNKELIIAYIMRVPPSLVDRVAAAGEDAVHAELVIKLSTGPVSLTANSSSWNDTHVAFVTEANSEDTKNLVQSLSGSKGKVLVGLKAPDGSKFTTTLAGGHASLVGKAIEACK